MIMSRHRVISQGSRVNKSNVGLQKWEKHTVKTLNNQSCIKCALSIFNIFYRQQIFEPSFPSVTSTLNATLGVVIFEE